ncbi:hypothetical protein [Methanooceanicella nereidis]|nr:hypothetical protein [Methanocella sp. CWC-04]
MKERKGSMEKCGICGKEVPHQPSCTEQGTCNICGAKLEVCRSK